MSLEKGISLFFAKACINLKPTPHPQSCLNGYVSSFLLGFNIATALEEKLKEIGEVTFSDSELDELTNKGFKLQTDLNNVKSLISQYQSSIKNLKTSESCQACGRKYDNVDNSGKIAEFEGLLTEQENKIPKLESDINENSKLISELKVKREQYNEK